MSFVVGMFVEDHDPYGRAMSRFYDLADGSLSMQPICFRDGMPIFSAEKLLTDIEKLLSGPFYTNKLVVGRCTMLEKEPENIKQEAEE